jgi:hypothetical protein
MSPGISIAVPVVGVPSKQKGVGSDFLLEIDCCLIWPAALDPNSLICTIRCKFGCRVARVSAIAVDCAST